MGLKFEGDKLSKKQIEKIIQRYKEARTGVARGSLRKAMEYVVFTSIDLAQLYPPAKPETSYIRTGRLRAGWNGEVVGGGRFVEGVIKNPVRYAALVQHEDRQLELHATWNTIQDIVTMVGNEPFFNAAEEIAIFMNTDI